MPKTAGAIQGSPATAIQYNGTNQAGVITKPDAYYDKLLLTMLRQLEFEYAKYAVEKTLPRNFGDTINWRRFLKLDPNTTALNEGVTPDGLTVSGTSVQAVIKQYGDVMYFTDLVDLQQLDDVKREFTVELGFLAKETLDLIVRNTLVGEGSVFFAGGVTTFGDLDGDTEAITLYGNTDVNTLVPVHRPKVDDFRKIVLGMKRAYLRGNRKANGKYVALVSPEVMFQLFDDQRMRDYMDFGNSNAPFGDGMTVDMFGLRFVEVLNAPIITGEWNAGTTQNPNTLAFDAHDSIVIAEESYAITKLQGQGVRVITKGLGSAGVEDPLEQRQSIGWKMTGFSSKVLNNEAVVNYWSVPGDFEATLQDPVADMTEYPGDGAFVEFILPKVKSNGIKLRHSSIIITTGTTYEQALAAARLSIDEGWTVELYADAAFAGSELTGTIDLTALTDNNVFIKIVEISN
jgi:N4-gp56 family major capsid protein